MSRESVEIVRRHFESANRREFTRAKGDFTEDVELFVSPNLFESGTFRGPDAVLRWFVDWLDCFMPGYRFELEDVLDTDDTVVVVARHHGRGRASGIEVHGRTSYVYRLRGRKIARVELYEKRSEAVRAAGVRDHPPAHS